MSGEPPPDPPAPDPPVDDELVDAVRLNLVLGVGPLIARGLLDRFGSASNVFLAHADQLNSVDRVGPKVISAIQESTRDTAERELSRCSESNTRVLLCGTGGYPDRLAAIPDPPPVLYCRGELAPQDEVAVAIVGSRSCTLYGRQQAERFARGLARAGVTVISGLARGIDKSAHEGALDAGGRTLAVVASGLTKLYPPEHVELARRVVADGAVLTESPLDRTPSRGLFPQRNRIISGLSQGVLIVEATRKSGALHTARHALEQGREVFALPGRVSDPTSEGCHDLIRDGVSLVRDVDDLLEQLGPLASPAVMEATTPSGETETRTVFGPRELALSEQERVVLDAVPTEPTPADEVVAALVAKAGLDTGRVLSTLTVLEMRRFVNRMPGGYVVRVPG